MAKLYNYMVEISSDYGEFPNRFLTVTHTNYDNAYVVAEVIRDAMELHSKIERFVALEDEDDE